MKFHELPGDDILFLQVESALAMRSLQPQIKAIQQRYAGDPVSFSSNPHCLIYPLTCEQISSDQLVKTCLSSLYHLGRRHSVWVDLLILFGG